MNNYCTSKESQPAGIYIPKRFSRSNIKALILLVALAVFCVQNAKASHLNGGDISWKCMPNGNYIFYLNLYLASYGTSFPFSGTRTISYQSGQIYLYPDSIKYAQINDPYSCGSIFDKIEVLTFKSNEVSLGAAPVGGWLFIFGNCCMSGSIENVVNSQTQGVTLRAKMYNTTGTCYDSSPQFIELPERYIPNGMAYNFGNLAVDEDRDSLVYTFDTPWSTAYQPISWENGYSQASPFPGPFQDTSNVAAHLNNANGSVSGEVHNMQTSTFAYSIKVDAYREGAKIATVWREARINIFNLPSLTGTNNHFPTLLLDSNSSNTHKVSLILGESINFPILAQDVDSVLADTSNPNSLHPQIIFLSASGMMFAHDYSNPNNCIDSNATCATLNPAMVLDSNGSYFLTDSGSVTTTFNWLTTCSLLESIDTTSEMLNSRVFNFSFKAEDLECPSAYTTKTLSITVKRYQPLIQKNGNQLYVDPAQSYEWFYNNTPLPNSDTNIISIQGNGNYSVEVVKYGCPSIKANLDVITSIPENELASVKVHPNPFQEAFVVELPFLQGYDIQIQLMDIGGREVKTSILRSNNSFIVDAKNELQQGIYILKISSKDQSILKKMIKL